MIEEPVGLKYRHDFAIDHILCESDYPHSDSTFPDTQPILEGLFADVPESEIEFMTYRNAEELFSFRFSFPRNSV